MRNGFLCVVATLGIGAGAVQAQYPAAYYPRGGYHGYPASYGYYPRPAGYYGQAGYPYQRVGYQAGAYGAYAPYTYGQPLAAPGSPMVYPTAPYASAVQGATVDNVQPEVVADGNHLTPPVVMGGLGHGGHVAPDGSGQDSHVMHEGCGPEGCGGDCMPAMPYCAPPQCEEPCCTFELGPKVWVRGEYLLWWLRNTPIPLPLVTTGPPGSGGVIGAAGTGVLFGNQSQSISPTSGGRLTIGTWLDHKHCFGLEGSGFVLGRQSYNFTAASTGFPVLAVPYFNTFGTPAVPFGENSVLLASAAAGQTGSVSISGGSRLLGADGSFLINLCRGCKGEVNFIGGFRYLDLNEDFNLSANTTAGPLFAQLADRFETTDRFYGGFVGVRGVLDYYRLHLSLMGRIALGQTQQTVQISGSSLVTAFPFLGTVTPGGIFSQPSNIGTFQNGQFTPIPEAQAMIGFDLTRHSRLFVGYNFLFWPNVVRPGTEINRAINVTQTLGGTLVGAPAPLPAFGISNFFAHGLSAGAEFRF